ncbi:GNAT family N-acetyltransferase [Streptomyces cirratus]|uniref:GNAT family N-acetyltransferase n=1 Tax=Streptomyces cirratus TaxID=68187 RepID=UPI003617E550
MTDAAAALEPGRQIDILDQLTEEQAEAVLALIADAARSDGTTAVSEQGRLQLRGGRREGIRHFLLTDKGRLAGYGQLEDTDPVEAPAAELVVDPSLRGRGHGRALGSALLAASGKRIRVWAHGGKSAARHLAQVLGLTLFRELRQLRRPSAPRRRRFPNRSCRPASPSAPSSPAPTTRPGSPRTPRPSPTTPSRAP